MPAVRNTTVTGTVAALLAGNGASAGLAEGKTT